MREGSFPTSTTIPETSWVVPLMKIRLCTSWPTSLPPVAAALCVPNRARTSLTVPSAAEVPKTAPLVASITETEALEEQIGRASGREGVVERVRHVALRDCG